jgi:hypothetical protein
MFGLVSAAQELAVEEIGRLPDAVVGEDLVAINAGMDRVEAEFLRRLAHFDRRRGFAADGSVSTAAWLRRNCRMSHATANEKVALARQLYDLPAVAEALAEGEIGYDSARVIGRTAAKVGLDAFRPAEQPMLEAARQLDPRRLEIVAAQVRYYADPDGVLADARHDHHLRWLELSQSFEGRYFLEGQLDAESGACLQAALDALMAPPAPGEDGAFSQRRADALVELARQALDRGALPEVAGQKPHLSLVIRADQGGAARLGWAGLVPEQTALRLACDSALTVIATGENGAIVEAGRGVRTVPPALRRALVARDGGCRFPGCDRPPDWTDGHHLKHWSRGGETRLANLVLLCRRHHRRVHEDGWRLAWAENGELLAAPP